MMSVPERALSELPEGYLSIPEWLNTAEYVLDRHIVEGRGDRIALYAPPDRTVTFGELAHMVDRCGLGLQSLGVKQGDRVVLHLPFQVELVVALLAALKIGAVPVMTNLLLSPEEFRRIVTHSDAVGALATAEHADMVATTPVKFGVVIGGDGASVGAVGWKSLLERGAGPLQPARTRAGDPAYMVYTSGSTGQPKGVIRPHRVTIGGGDPSRYFLLALKPGDVCYYPSRDLSFCFPLSHGCLFPLMAGVSIVIEPARRDRRFHPESVLKTIERYRVTHFLGVATMYRHLLAVMAEGGNWDISSVRRWVSGGEQLGAAAIEEWQSRFGKPVEESFGQSEASTFLGYYPGVPVKPGSLGKALPGLEALVVDEAGNPVPAGEVGQLALPADSPNLALGYYKDPQRWADVCRDGVYFTGDLVYRDEDGYFWWVGRADEMFKSRGYKVYPIEVEQALARHPAVRDAGVIGAPSEERGHSVIAYVSLRPGYIPGDALAQELREHCRAYLPAYKIPEAIYFMDDLPKTPSGKVQRRVLLQQYLQKA